MRCKMERWVMKRTRYVRETCVGDRYHLYIYYIHVICQSLDFFVDRKQEEGWREPLGHQIFGQFLIQG